MNLLLFNLSVDRDHTALGFTTDWINELAKHFDAVTVITMHRGRVEVADNVTVLSAGLERGWSKPRRVVEFYRCLFRALRMRRHDVCFAHMMPLFLLLAGPVLKARGIPAVLWYAHNHRAWDLAPALAFASRAVASTRAGFPIATGKLRVIGQGIDTERFRPASDAPLSNRLRLFSVGRLTPVKNIDLMIRAFAALRTAHPELACSLTLVGKASSDRDRAYVARCRALADELAVADALEWLPPVPFGDMHEAYRLGDVFLSACASGLDKTILEAMASGLPVVATNPIVADVLGSSYAADDDEFVAAVTRLAVLPGDERGRIGARLREYVIREHSLAQLGRRLVQNLQEVGR